MGLNPTKCPYCGATNSYEWQESAVAHLGDTAFLAHPINVAEVYCKECHHTLSLIPLTGKY